MDKKQNTETVAAIIIVALIIVVIVIFIFFGSVGMPIWDIRNNPENYVNKSQASPLKTSKLRLKLYIIYLIT